MVNGGDTQLAQKPVRKQQVRDARALRRRDPVVYTQEVLASMYGVDRATISRWAGDENESNVQSHIAFVPPPDARVSIPKGEYGRSSSNQW